MTSCKFSSQGGSRICNSLNKLPRYTPRYTFNQVGQRVFDIWLLKSQTQHDRMAGGECVCVCVWINKADGERPERRGHLGVFRHFSFTGMNLFNINFTKSLNKH